MGLGAGNIALMHVGGIYGRWEFVTTGPPLSQVSQAQARAQPGEVIVSPETWAFLQSHFITGNGPPPVVGVVVPLLLKWLAGLIVGTP